MRINEEIDALETMGVPSVPFLVSTRMLAALLVMPLMYVLSLACSFLASWIVQHFQIGLVSEVCPGAELHERAQWVAGVIAERPPLAIQATLRATWAAHELSRSQALALGYAYVGLGTSQESIAEGQQAFASGQRVEWRLR